MTLAAHDDAAYARALAHVGLRVSAAEAVHISTIALLADLRRSRCACCGQRFAPTKARQLYCGALDCDRRRAVIRQRHSRSHARAVRLDRLPLGRDLACICGARLEAEVQAGGAVMDHCPRCGAVTPMRRAA